MKKVLIFLLLFFIPLSYAQSELLATSYWGYITENGIPKSNASITVLDANGKEIVKSTSNQDGLYQITVPWDDPATPVNEGVAASETISFKVDGKIAASSVIEAKGSNNRLDLNIKAIATTTTYSSSKGSGWDQTQTATPTPIQTQTVTVTMTPVQTVRQTPTTIQTVKETPASVQTATETRTPTPTPLPPPTKNTPGFGVIAAIVVLIYIAFARNHNGK